MEKEFFDVFPNLKLKQELSELLEEVIELTGYVAELQAEDTDEIVIFPSY